MEAEKYNTITYDLLFNFKDFKFNQYEESVQIRLLNIFNKKYGKILHGKSLNKWKKSQ